VPVQFDRSFLLEKSGALQSHPDTVNSEANLKIFLQRPSECTLGIAVLLAFAAASASAAPLMITCENEDVIALDWKAPLTVTYDGEATGTLTVQSQHIALSLPAKKEVRTGELDGKPHSVTGITGNADTNAVMPDLAALDACAQSSIEPELKDDADMYAVAIMSCLSKTKPGATPVKVAASVSVALIPSDEAGAPDVVVEIKRTYLDKSASPGGTASIGTFPKNCAITSK
jgi:hypothetical protein